MRKVSIHINDICRQIDPFPNLWVVEPNSKLPPAHILPTVTSFPFYLLVSHFPYRLFPQGHLGNGSILLAVIGVRKHFLYGQ